MGKFASVRCCAGTALLETALVLPLLLLLMLNTVNFGTYIYAWITLDNAARAAAQYSAYNGVVVNFPGEPTFAQIQALICGPTGDVSHLPHFSATCANPTLEVCSNNNGTVTCNGVGSHTSFADPEPSRYTVFEADLTYTYTPAFSSFTIPYLKVSLTLPATTLHRQVTMRSMQ
jgi:Flp pilus assembly protein TadG